MTNKKRHKARKYTLYLDLVMLMIIMIMIIVIIIIMIIDHNYDNDDGDVVCGVIAFGILMFVYRERLPLQRHHPSMS